MEKLPNPFDYPKPKKEISEERREWRRQWQREYRERKARAEGRELSTWGGSRRNSGRPLAGQYTHHVKLILSEVQEKILEEMGRGDISMGVQALIKENM